MYAGAEFCYQPTLLLGLCLPEVLQQYLTCFIGGPGRLDVVNKNFAFKSIPFSELVSRCASVGPPLVAEVERCGCNP